MVELRTGERVLVRCDGAVELESNQNGSCERCADISNNLRSNR